ncbi:hypothetical protein E4T66_17745 [Sinimarinibacterium sp. CAU 1509]|uniref:hypothetical protein n=1 Tax=Sinimarinibacterium sp. CAU 1509 TaxID=2562283 RepID=UPI0010AD1A75|nr:hypothetical protein [Sinimarinibacterium sp. CAU 1509]TJY57251.1 hypothetical protein E4T66_17745 [Sinimarinibacterium sp. CAU 1509]
MDLVLRVDASRPLRHGDLPESLQRAVLCGWKHVLLEPRRKLWVDVRALAHELVTSETPVGFGAIHVPSSAQSLLGIEPGETLLQFRERFARNAFVWRAALWDWRHAAALAGMQQGLDRPALLIRDRHGTTLLDGHHRLGAHAFRLSEWMPAVVVEDAALLRRHSQRFRKTRRSLD